MGSASMAASAPPNSLTSARKVAGPTFSLRISLSQAIRWRGSSRTAALWRRALAAAFANARLLALRQPSDVGGMADKEKHGQQQEERAKRPVSGDREQGYACGTCGERRERGIARGEGDNQPDGAEGDAGRPVKPEQDTDIGGDPFAAVEAEPDGEEMAEKGAEPGQERRRLAPVRSEQHGGRPLGSIEEERQRGELLGARAQDIGRPDIAGAD